MGFLYKPVSGHDKNFEFPSKFHIFLKINGCWPTDGDVNSCCYRLLDKLYTFLSWFAMACVLYACILEAVYFVVNILDIKKAVETMCPCVIGAMSMLRVLLVRIDMKSFKRLLGRFADKIWINEESHPQIFAKCIKRTLPTYYLSITLWLVLLLYTFQPIIKFITTEQTMESNNKSFPYYMIAPYDIQSQWNYILTYIEATYVGVITVSMFYGVDALLALFVSFLSGQFDILHGSIARLIPECYAEWKGRNGGVEVAADGKSLKDLQDMYTKRLHEIAARHGELISFCMDLENFLSIILTLNVVISTFQICLNSFQFLLAGSTSFGDFMRFFLFFFSVTGQLFVVCNLGSFLITRSLDTARFLYACNWEGGRLSMNSPLLLQPDEMELDKLSLKLPSWKNLNYPPTNDDFRHKLRLMIMRSNRPVQLTAMKFTIVSLESFSRILSSSMSYFALLKTFLDKQI